ncbi:peptidylprolyl isomerase [Amphiplicatus metriothermophilus]|uniref:peptidylprolyl isomerase n=1 Tax=Amphiplicatus metriothermophilus TaxID=1519374 RepID=UPI00135CC160|nr:peptidylprolyl isomerase [Amphiplicatus metriothermophilus]MBB5519793.1 peptidyl-prolyl cis-trans isomerase SurA [Amphiplicatus metriothermophilus]
MTLAQPRPGSQGDQEGLPEGYVGPATAVAAIVNDEVITTFDVQQRVRLMLLSVAGRQITEDLLAQLQAQALRDLVEEKLKLQEAKKFEVEVDEAELEAELRAMAGSSGLSVAELEQVLAAQGISMRALRDQIRASIAWPRIVQGRYGSRVRVSDEEIEQTIERMREDATNEQYLVSEICIPVPNPSQAQAYYQGSLQLIEQMRRGVPFAVVAQQFSACSSAAAGGDLGWVRAGELPPELDEAVKALPVGSVTNPIPSDGAFMILAVRDKREAVVAGEPTFTLAYAAAPLSMGRNAALMGLEKLRTADACGSGALRRDLGPGIGAAFLENMKLKDIDPRFRSAVEDLDRREMSAPVEADGALHAVYVCEKDEGLGLPSRAAVEDRIYGRQLGRIAQQYLRDLERAAHVDIRMRPEAALQNRG